MSTTALPGGRVSGAKALWARFRTGPVGTLARAIASNRKATAGFVILAVFCFLAAFPGLIAHDNPQAEIYQPTLGRRVPICSAPRPTARTCSPS
jgi:hypothetical protein